MPVCASAASIIKACLELNGYQVQGMQQVEAAVVVQCWRASFWLHRSSCPLSGYLRLLCCI